MTARNPMLGDPDALFIHQIAMRRNPRAFDLTTRSRAVVPQPRSDRERIERLRIDPIVQFDELVTRKLPRGVVP